MIDKIRSEIQKHAVAPEQRKAVFFKMGEGEYAAHDQFLGVPVPHLRAIAKQYRALALPIILEFLHSSINEERLFALILMVERYQTGNVAIREEIFKEYQCQIRYINNWNLVDASAHLIVGAYLYGKEKSYLATLAKSASLWERRIAIVATWYFIRQNDFEWTIKLAEILMHDKEDLLHKAVGWMLREMGKRDEQPLLMFLEQHAHNMPRTMLRYALEKFSKAVRVDYMSRKT